MNIQWYRKHVLLPHARKAAMEWAVSNRENIGNLVVIPVSHTSAIVEYEQDQVTSHIFFFTPKGQKKPVFTGPDYIPSDNHRRMKYRVEKAYQEYRLSMLDAERVELAATQKINDPRQRRQQT